MADWVTPPGDTVVSDTPSASPSGWVTPPGDTVVQEAGTNETPTPTTIPENTPVSAPPAAPMEGIGQRIINVGKAALAVPDVAAAGLSSLAAAGVADTGALANQALGYLGDKFNWSPKTKTAINDWLFSGTTPEQFQQQAKQAIYSPPETEYGKALATTIGNSLPVKVLTNATNLAGQVVEAASGNHVLGQTTEDALNAAVPYGVTKALPLVGGAIKEGYSGFNNLSTAGKATAGLAAVNTAYHVISGEPMGLFSYALDAIPLIPKISDMLKSWMTKPDLDSITKQAVEENFIPPTATSGSAPGSFYTWKGPTIPPSEADFNKAAMSVAQNIIDRYNRGRNWHKAAVGATIMGAGLGMEKQQ